MAVSDATATTCELLVKSALSQFHNVEVELEKIAFVRSEEEVVAILERAEKRRSVVIYTIVSPTLRDRMLELGRAYGVPTVDVLGPVLMRLSDLLEISPLADPALLHALDEDYFRRINSLDFAVTHDDGLGLSDIHNAEIIICGVSRASKTPTSVYLAYRGWKVANIPVVVGTEFPEAVLAVDQRRVVGLTIDRQLLMAIRRNREAGFGHSSIPGYTDEHAIQEELAYALRTFQRHNWPVIDVSHKSIEENATEIMQLISKRTGQAKPTPFHDPPS